MQDLGCVLNSQLGTQSIVWFNDAIIDHSLNPVGPSQVTSRELV